MDDALEIAEQTEIWLITPGPRPQEVRVDFYDPRRPGIVVDVGIFDARTGGWSASTACNRSKRKGIVRRRCAIDCHTLDGIACGTIA